MWGKKETFFKGSPFAPARLRLRRKERDSRRDGKTEVLGAKGHLFKKGCPFSPKPPFLIQNAVVRNRIFSLIIEEKSRASLNAVWKKKGGAGEKGNLFKGSPFASARMAIRTKDQIRTEDLIRPAASRATFPSKGKAFGIA